MAQTTEPGSLGPLSPLGPPGSAVRTVGGSAAPAVRPTVFSGPFLYGGDYNPEQWPREELAQDLELLKDAGVNALTLNVFSWALLQTDDDTYDFSGLDAIVAAVTEAGMSIDLATSTGAVPPWLARKHPEICRVDAHGNRRVHGDRENACLTSTIYRTHAARLAGKLAQRYGGLENLICWHVSNEYWGSCYCDTCTASFRDWLQARHGTIAHLNEEWGAAFWSHTYSSFDEINLPTDLGDVQGGVNTLPGQQLDFRRWAGDTALAAYRLEKDAIREFDPATPIMTNLMMPFDGYDYARWADDLDVVAWDSYPPRDAPASRIGLHHAVMRGLKRDRPFLLLEQTPTRQSITRASKRPGQMREQSW